MLFFEAINSINLFVSLDLSFAALQRGGDSRKKPCRINDIEDLFLSDRSGCAVDNDTARKDVLLGTYDSLFGTLA